MRRIFLRAQRQNSAANQFARAALQIDVIGRQRDNAALFQRAHKATLKRQQCLGAEQINLQITMRNFNRHIRANIAAVLLQQIAPIHRVDPCLSDPVLLVFPLAVCRICRDHITGVFDAVQRFLFAHHQIIILDNHHIADTTARGRDSQFRNPRQYRLGKASNRILGLDHQISVHAFNPACVGVDQATIGNLDPHPARTVCARRKV